MSALCERQSQVWVISKQDFLKLQGNSQVWKTFSEMTNLRIERLSKSIISNTFAEATVVNNLSKIKYQQKQ
jgi:hypothetical protein